MKNKIQGILLRNKGVDSGTVAYIIQALVLTEVMNVPLRSPGDNMPIYCIGYKVGVVEQRDSIYWHLLEEGSK